MDISRVERELEIITRMIWQPDLPSELVRIHELPLEVISGETYTGCVHILGGWCGSVSIECQPGMARFVATRVLGLENEKCSTEEWQTVLKELVNVTGGNVKGLLGHNCILSTPTIVIGKDFGFYVPETPEILRLCFCCDDQYFVVRLHEGTLELDSL